jgi:hypothetical protein
MKEQPKWHDRAQKRAQIGGEAEEAFARQTRCHCGGIWNFIGDIYPGCPDFTCIECSQLAEVKTSPISINTGNISVSVEPWQHYPPDLALVTKINRTWKAGYKHQIEPVGRPLASTHTGAARVDGKNLGSTAFILISWNDFQDFNKNRLPLPFP